VAFAQRSTSFFCRLWLAGAVLACAGCGSSIEFPPDDVYLRLQESATRIELSTQQRQDIAAILEHWFGTPDEPRIPAVEGAEFSTLLDLDRLQMSAGPFGSEEDGTPFGLYRRDCAICHGISGNGVGPTAGFLNPYPRDFRRGIFKYQSTAGTVTPPTDEDLRTILVRGMPDTSMPSFRLLSDVELDSLVDYVKYLAIRGAVERALIVESVDVLEGPQDRLADVSLRDSDPPRFEQQLDDLAPLVAFVARGWHNAAQRVTEIPPRPADRDPIASVARGRELYLGDVANCVKCHGPDGRGDSEAIDYDDWTREIFPDPLNRQAVRPYLSLGALKPRPTRPRDLRRGIFHGGDRPEDLYLRIKNGIAGTPMPAAPMKAEDAPPDDIRLAPSDIWHLVDYVLSLSDPHAYRLALGDSAGEQPEPRIMRAAH
jgi:mono/diheme cytochrome c family protein